MSWLCRTLRAPELDYHINTQNAMGCNGATTVYRTVIGSQFINAAIVVGHVLACHYHIQQCSTADSSTYLRKPVGSGSVQQGPFHIPDKCRHKEYSASDTLGPRGSRRAAPAWCIRLQREQSANDGQALN